MLLGYSDLVIDRIIGDHLMNPWFDKVAVYGFTTFMLGLLFVWVHRRINDAQIYRVLAVSLGVNGAVVLFFGRNAYPHPLAALLFFASLFFTLSAVVAICTVFAVQRGPDFGLPESAVMDVDDHTPKRQIPFVVTTTLLVLFWLSVTAPFVLLDQLLGALTWALAGFMVMVVSTVAYALVPVTEVRETAFLTESAPPKEIEDIFAINGPVNNVEKMTVPLLSLSFWGFGMYFAANGARLAGDDFVGAVFLLLLGLSILLTEMARARRTGAADTPGDQQARNI
ncbi:MAG: hypothetical protein EB084_02540 [Proteobacteria bacterium]|nr:hypothetical protein [Pseudomonadota bacterium]